MPVFTRRIAISWPIATLFLLTVLTTRNVLAQGSGKHHRRPGAHGAHGGRARSSGGPGSSHKITTSISGLNMIDEPGKFALTTMTVHNRHDSRWYVPHFHNKYSSGWNRSFAHPFTNHPVACNIRFFALALESTLKDHKYGGTGYMTIYFTPGKGKKTLYHGFSKNESERLHCYYMTSKGYGSEFLDNPKTLGVAIYCPVPIDHEVIHLHGPLCRTDILTNLTHPNMSSFYLRPQAWFVLR
jgi:hypothetical protein